MCGIVGYIGDQDAASILLGGLKKLEYRGYDSCGISTINNNQITTIKDIGKIEEVEKKHNFLELKGNIGLAHSRWATTGGVTKENAHPHSDCNNKVSIIHNGIIENFDEIKNNLKNYNHFFTSETDTEIIAHLIEQNYKDDLKEAVIKTIKEIKGSFSLGIIHLDHPDTIIAVKNESPLIIGLGNIKKENFIASDVPAILNHTNKIIYLEDFEIAELKKDKVTITDLDNNTLSKKVNTITWTPEQAEKQGFKHFMLKEIFEQPIAIENTLSPRLQNHSLDLTNDLKINEQEIKDIKKIIILACGTSWHSGLYGRFILEGIAKIPTQTEYASEFRYKEQLIESNTLIIAISQSGETADTLAAIKEAKKQNNNVKILSILNVQGSSIDRISDYSIYTNAGPEIGVASTKAFTTQLTMLYLLTLHFGKIKETINQQVLNDAITGLRKIPLQIQSVLDESKKIKQLADHFYNKSNALYLGRGANFPIALEGALKLKEISYIHAEGYPAAEMKHGPIALIDKNMPVIFIATKDSKTHTKILGNIDEVKARGGEIIAIATKGDSLTEQKSDHIIYVPDNLYTLQPFLSTIILQLFAYYVAVLRKKDPDRPRSLAKAVTVE